MVNKTMPYVTVEIVDGKCTVEAHNYKGKGCVEIVDEINKSLGGEVVSSRNKPEIHLPAPIVQQPLRHQ